MVSRSVDPLTTIYSFLIWYSTRRFFVHSLIFHGPLREQSKFPGSGKESLWNELIEFRCTLISNTSMKSLWIGHAVLISLTNVSRLRLSNGVAHNVTSTLQTSSAAVA